MLSIITPTLNAENFIDLNIRSIKKLPFSVEHIIVDGGSCDKTLEIVNQYRHCKILRQKDKMGMYSAIDQGFKEAEGKYICYVNADDQVVTDGYVKMYNEIISGTYDLVYSDGCFYWQEDDRCEKIKGKRFGKYHLKNGLLPFIQPSSIYTKQIYLNVGGLDFNNYKICGDLDLFQRMAFLSESKFKYVPAVSSIFLKYGNSLGDKNEELYHEERMQLTVDNSQGVFNRVLFKLSSI